MIIKRFAACLLMLLLTGFNLTGVEAEERSVVGRLKIFSLDENDKVTEVYIEIEDEKYLIRSERMMKELLPHVGKDVRLTGKISVLEDMNKVLDLSSYEIIDSTRNDDAEKEQ